MPRRPRRLHGWFNTRRPLELHAPLCIGLLASASSLALLSVFDEATYHTDAPGAAVALSITALLTGMVLGVVVPRAVIAARAAGTAMLPPSPTFAGSAAGVLLLASAALWLALLLGAAAFERYRGWLVDHLLAPHWLLRFLLWAPALSGVALAGAISATTLLALHGWRRLTTPERGASAWDCVIALLTVAIVAFAAWLIARPDVALFAAPFLLCVAALVASISPSRERLTPTAQRVAPAAPELMPLLAGALTGFCLTVALLRAVEDQRPMPLLIAGAALSGAVGAGIAGGMLGLATPAFSARSALLAAVTLFLPFERVFGARDADAIRVCAVAIVGAAAMVLLGRSLAEQCRSSQRALATLGSMISIGGVAAALATLMPNGGVASAGSGAAQGESPARVAQRLLRSGSADQRVAVVALTHEVDLTVPLATLDALTIDAYPEAPSAAQATRLVGRIERGMIGASRLALALPAPQAVLAALERSARRRRTEVYCLTIDGAGDSAEYLLLGDDAREWLQHEADQRAHAISLKPWRGAASAESSRE